MSSLESQFQTLEEALLHTDFRAFPGDIDEILDDEFVELGSNGRFTHRPQVVKWLLKKNIEERWCLHQFQARQLAPEIVLVSYIAVKENSPMSSTMSSQRSSIWRKHSDTWKLVFHQATPII